MENKIWVYLSSLESIGSVLSQLQLIQCIHSRKPVSFTQKSASQNQEKTNSNTICEWAFIGASMAVVSPCVVVFTALICFPPPTDSFFIIIFGEKGVNDIIIEFYGGAWYCECVLSLQWSYSRDYSNHKNAMRNDVPFVTSTDVSAIAKSLKVFFFFSF